MADIDDIATRIAGVILSPESVNGLINGAFTVPLDMGYMVYGVFDTGSRSGVIQLELEWLAL
jgi:hypothetical protein